MKYPQQIESPAYEPVALKVNFDLKDKYIFCER
jgi:hypothetical protein